MFFTYPHEQYPEQVDFFDIEDQFMWGDVLMVSPVLHDGHRFTKTYFPDDKFYNFYTGKVMEFRREVAIITADLTVIPIFIRAGHLMPLQDTDDVLSVVELRKKPIELLIALDNSGASKGVVVLDDGISIDTIEKKAYDIYRVSVLSHSTSNSKDKRTKITIQPEVTGFKKPQDEYPSFSKITIYGIIQSEIKKVQKIIDEKRYELGKECYEFDKDLQKLIIFKCLSLPTGKIGKVLIE